MRTIKPQVSALSQPSSSRIFSVEGDGNLPRENGNFHCFNVVETRSLDATSEQFGDTVLDYENCTEQSRYKHFSKEEKRLRYELLKKMHREKVRERLRDM